MLPLGTRIPEFSLENAVDGRTVSAMDLRGPAGVVVMFICNHCPFVKHVMEEIGYLANDYASHGIAFAAINSNDVTQYPDDAPALMKELAEAQGWEFPFLFDESQDVAKAFKAACTPDFFIFDEDQKLVYRGQIDDSRPEGEIPVTGGDLRAALDALLAGLPVAEDQKPSLGCNIKWTAGNEPDYFRSKA
jgi:thiol-disulfide isomerase/thioredoxin